MENVVDLFTTECYKAKLQKDIISAFYELCRKGGTYKIEVEALTVDNTVIKINKMLEFEPAPMSRYGGSNPIEDGDKEFSTKLYKDLVEKYNWSSVTISKKGSKKRQRWYKVK